MRQIKLVIEYEGTNYHGWQIQAQVRTIQEEISKKISQMIGEKVTLLGAGRTDAGVHAWGQVACFKTSSQIPLEGLYRGLNSLLPPDIVIKSVVEVPKIFIPNIAPAARSTNMLFSIKNSFGHPSSFCLAYSFSFRFVSHAESG